LVTAEDAENAERRREEATLSSSSAFFASSAVFLLIRLNREQKILNRLLGATVAEPVEATVGYCQWCLRQAQAPI
jgi:hypothetical protein